MEAQSAPSLTDPFYLVKDEVQQSVNTVNQLHDRWKQLLESETSTAAEFEQANQELISQTKAVLDDIGMMQESINVVEQKPKFGITSEEIQSRRDYVRVTQDQMKAILRETQQDAAVHAKMQKKQREALLASSRPRENKRDRYAKLEQEMEQDNQRFIDGEEQRQQMVIKQQDQHLDAVSDTTKRLKNLAGDMGTALAEQDQMLGELGSSVERNQKKVNFLQKQLNKLLKNKERGKFCIIFLLIVVLIVLIVILVHSSLTKKSS
eukprot:GAFH01003072.1.p1 GENE.GAFH01003072.1~~GAFH01003072.1.p1  ORF type:complete len:274 (-),score=89.10 GAFH01003072.1:189-980(-)